MGKVLKITRADKTVHIVPIANKAALTSYNNKLQPDFKMKIEEIDEEDASVLPYIDEKHVTGSEAITQNAELKEALSAKDQEIEDLKRLLAAKSGGGDPKPPVLTAVEKIDLINAATAADQVEALLVGEERKTVIDAGNKKLEQLKSA